MIVNKCIIQKSCKNCHSLFDIYIPRLVESKVFCSLSCSQDWWKIKRNKTGISFSNPKKFGIFSRKNLNLNEDQTQLLLGSLLGDGYIRERINKSITSYNYSEGHSIKQIDYLIHKMNSLKGFISQKNPTHIKPNGYSKIPKVSMTSIVHNDFKILSDLFYKKHKGIRIKTITIKLLNMIKPLALLYWYLDDGDYSKKKTIKLSTYSFSKKEHIIIKKWFKDNFDINSIISSINRNEKNMFYIRMNRIDSDKFISLITPFKHIIPESMHYKIPSIKSVK